MDKSKPVLSQLSKLDWLVEARNTIQSFMLDLYKHKPPHSTEPNLEHLERNKEWHLYLGASFSLWRAVFLIEDNDVAREIGTLNEKAVDFLGTVIQNNTITFSDDRRMGSWSSGYYLNNARYRVKILLKDCTDIKLKEHITNAVMKDVWNETYTGMTNAFEKFKFNFQ